ncbi:hypothetical protein JCM10212_003732 [Sporobolomyces blumeae]
MLLRLRVQASSRSCPSLCLINRSTRAFSSSTRTHRQPVKIVEVGPRDGLQNEKHLVPTETKVELVKRLVDAGCRDVEVGSFVAPKWVPQMASTPDLLQSTTLEHLRATHESLSLPVLIPNARGLDSLFALLDAQEASSPPLTNEIAVFVGCTEGFSRANLNCSVRESLDRLPPLIERAKARGLRVRGYVSTVLGCPFDGKVEPERPAAVVRELVDMGCEEVSLGDTIGVGVPSGWEQLVGACVKQGVEVDKLAIHAHDTYGTALASVLHAVQILGISTVDSSLSSLGGCPYSPNSTGNVSTEDVLYLLSTSAIPTKLIPHPLASEELFDFASSSSSTSDSRATFHRLCETGEWISRELGRENGSRVGKARRARKDRAEKRAHEGRGDAKDKAKAKL